MAKIKVSELFKSLQGEGQYVGVPSIFLRTFGCNFRCKKFGINRDIEVDEYNPEVAEVIKNINQYKDFKELPLVSTGCDTYGAIYPEFKHLSPMVEITDIVNYCQSVLVGGKFDRDQHLVITGGEPLLGWQRAYPNLLSEIYNRDMNLTHLTFETNGTQPLQEEFKTILENYAVYNNLEITFSISAKLPASGESWNNSILPFVVKNYVSITNNRSYFKFVVATEEDVNDAIKAIAIYRSTGIDIPVYLMPVGGVNSVYELNERQVADFCKDKGFRFSPRIQVPLYKNQWGT